MEESVSGVGVLDKAVAILAALEPRPATLIFVPIQQMVRPFDTRDLDKSQPKMDCGSHVITGGTGKYKGIIGNEPFACISMPALAGPGGYTAMDIPHNTSWR